MKATGVVRRLDDLGRLVIPKEIRKQYRMKEGDAIEFYIENGKIVLQKYDSLSQQENELLDMCGAMEKHYKKPIYFIRNTILGHKEKCTKGILTKCVTYRPTTFTNEKIFEQDTQPTNGIFFPVVIDGYWQGSFILIGESEEHQVIEAFVEFLTRKVQI